MLAAAALAGTDQPRHQGVPAPGREAAVQEVADYLGNPPTIATSSSIDPRVFGTTIDPAILPRPGSPTTRQRALEKAVDLLG